jgi:hypothetical protein
MSELEDSIENCDRSERLELEESIGSMPSNPYQLKGEIVIGDLLPTHPTDTHPRRQGRSIYRREKNDNRERY